MQTRVSFDLDIDKLRYSKRLHISYFYHVFLIKGCVRFAYLLRERSNRQIELLWAIPRIVQGIQRACLGELPDMNKRLTCV